MCFYLMLYHHNPSFFQNSQLGIFPLKNSTNYEQKYQNLVFSPKHETKPQPKFGKPFHDMVYLLFIIFLVQTTFILHLPKINPLKTSTKIKHKNPTKFWNSISMTWFKTKTNHQLDFIIKICGMVRKQQTPHKPKFRKCNHGMVAKCKTVGFSNLITNKEMIAM